jgi:hypothetical protein
LYWAGGDPERSGATADWRLVCEEFSMFGTRIRVTATAVPGALPVRGRVRNPRATPAPGSLFGAAGRLNAARGSQ